MIEIETLIPTPIKTVWDSLTDEEHIRQWWDKDVTLELKIGGRFCEPWTDKKRAKHITLGTVTALEAEKRLQIKWQDAGWPMSTLVDFTLRHDEQGGTRLLIQHSGWGAFENDKERRVKFDEYHASWKELAEKLRDYCMR